ncbi:hypothetical protein O6H91_18G051300 [Diphasiastrum complanatum]|uniref:Uncharacterized protein n=4 Tax=Diphasiastrum complanatum TaxID=34168 RepID=A0ACC2B126_DIPCM|nr:hypothetical protein O6H91_18G051300 [Diphasiastrum complanatum]KAJ7523479.1 hypothetical protein O6H91_18G051300 [Diphasiastrum complanatum]KAJ7523480.1 hypothetical protein O6H91_18G051300 [Diphasiastrum complanatum]KAJ7523481.1 hypothetical protein O6H91_18G051300 [Diphasiastrum complanatum]
MAESLPHLASLKVKELLREVQVDYDNTSAVEDVVRAVRELLLQIPAQEVPWTYAKAFVKDLGVPIKKAKFFAQKIESVETVGSYSLQALVKPVLVVDLAVRIPKTCFHEKDYLNHRYHVKRSLFLAMIEKHLRSSAIIKQVEWAFFQHDARKPVLILHPGTDESAAGVKFALRLIPTISEEVFDKTKLASNRNNVREAKFNGLEGSLQATPCYNASILEDMFVETDNKMLNSTLSTSSSLREAIVLLKVWLQQRNFHSHPDGLNGFLMSMFVFHLTTVAGGQRVTKHMTSLQIFRVTMESLANQHFLHTGIFMGLDKDGTKLLEMKKKHAQTSEFLWCNPSGYLNLSSRMTASSLQELKHEAVQTLAAMKDSSMDSGFNELFMVPVDFSAKYDCHVRLKPQDFSKVLSGPCYLDDGRWKLFEENVEDLIRKGFGDRALLVRAVHRTLPSGWSLKQGLTNLGKEPLNVGILLSSFETAFRMVDIGPSADMEEEARKFRTFWGKKAELRRFKDGKISETVAWECEPWKRHLIPQQIVEHVLAEHLSLLPTNIEVVAGQLDFSFWQNGRDPAVSMPKLLDAFDSLSKHLRSLENIPLKVSSVQPLSSDFRHAAVFPPEPHVLARGGSKLTIRRHPIPACLDPLEIMIQLEGSGKWPSDQAALQKTKLAFSLRIAEGFHKQWGIPSIASEDAVDLLWQGFAFRIRIFYEKDPTLLRQNPGKSFSGNQNSAPYLLEPKKDLLLRSVHSSMLYGLQGLYPVYSPTVRLAKRWVAAHFFSGVLAEEAIELLVAYLFLRPFPLSPPVSRISGLLRFLRLLANHDWALVPLIVDVNRDLDVKQQLNIVSLFDASRQETGARTSQPTKDDIAGPAMYIATPYDLESATWTRTSPSSLELKRMVAYAKSSAELLNGNITADANRWQSLFRTPLQCYNLLIRLQRKALPFPNRILFPADIEAEAAISAKPYDEEPLASLPLSILKRGLEEAQKELLIGFDPVSEFVQEIKMKYGEVFSIWYDAIGSDCIGLTFKKLGAHYKAVNGKRKRIVNGYDASDFDDILRDIIEIGDGLVQSVHAVGQK